MSGSDPRRKAFGRTGPFLSGAAVVALGFILWRADWQEMARPLLSASPGWIATAVLLAISVELFKTVRWQLLLDLPARAFPRLLAVVFSSRVLNALTPVRAGDVWRVASTSRTENRPLVLVAGSVLAEKALDGASLAVVGILFVGWSGIPAGWGLPQMAIAASVLAITCVLALDIVRRLAARMGLESWLRSASHLRDPARLTAVGLLTVAGIAPGLVVNMAVLAALGLPADVSLGATMLVSAYASGMLPSGPGQVGVFELAVGSALIASGLPAGQAVSAAVAVHLVLLANLAIGGMLSLPLGSLGVGSRASTGSNAPIPSSTEGTGQ